MSDFTKNIKEIRKDIAIGLANQFLPFMLIALFVSWFEGIPNIAALGAIFGVFALILFAYGYGLSASAIDKYATYKGYRNFCFIYSILNIFGLSILFLLRNKNLARNSDTNREPLDNFSIAAIFYSYLSVPLVVISLISIPITIYTKENFIELYENNQNFNELINIIISIFIANYFFQELNRAKLRKRIIFGSLKELNWKLPIGLAIVQYFFNRGINPITLYILSFIAPTYVENQVNQEYATTVLGWISFFFFALIYAPIMEELFFRGIIFQKVAIKKNMFKGLLISAVLFAVMHLRFDIIPLCLFGIVTAILYFKTKQLASPIIYHFTYNLIVVSKRTYYHFFVNPTFPTQTTILELQQHIVDNLDTCAFFLAITVPYLTYFIYKNFPRDRDINKLPYFVNQ